MSKSAKPEKSTLPLSIVNALPTAAAIMQVMKQVEALIPKLDKELQKAKKGGAITMARAYVALHRMEDRIDQILKPIYGKEQLVDRYKTFEIPQLFEQEGVSNVPLAEGFRVGISSRFLASILPDKKEDAHKWLRDNGLGDIIAETINSGTLSATLKRELEEKNREAPDNLFKIAMVPTTSVTATK